MSSSNLPHMIPSAEHFQAEMQALGLRAGQQIIVYDNSPFCLLRGLGGCFAFWASRCCCIGWWAAPGSPPVARSQIRSLTCPKAPFSKCIRRSFDVITFNELEQDVRNGQAEQIIDARAADRFAGQASEPRPGLRAGHIPGSLNLPISEILDKTTGHLKPADELSALFVDAGVVMDKPAVTTCGSGVTAAGLTLALAILGKTDIRLYDGSWSEWGASNAPIET